MRPNSFVLGAAKAGTTAFQHDLGAHPQIRLSRLILPLALAAGLLAPSAGLAQLGGGESGNRVEGRAKFVPLPYVGYNRSTGFAFGLLPMVMFNPVERDTLSPSSIAGALGMYTTNETWFFMGFTKFFLAEDTWRVTAVGGTGSINFQFHLESPIDVWVPDNTAADFVYTGLERRVWRDLFLGASYI